MIRPKNLDMEKIEKLFEDNFTFEREDLEKGITCWTITPKRENESEQSEQSERGSLCLTISKS